MAGRRSGRLGRMLAAIACLGVAPVAPQLQAQSVVFRALDLEDSAKWQDAAALYRTVLRGPESAMALLGLERALVMLNQGQELAATLQQLIHGGEDNEVLRPMYVRALLRLERRDAAFVFVQRWILERPQDPEAYRQLYALGPLSADEARLLWTRMRGWADTDWARAIAVDFTEQVFAAGHWSVARDILEERYRRDRSPEMADQLALAAARAGATDRAAAVIREAQLTAESAAAAWLALYEGDLVAARRLLSRADEADRGAILPLAVVSRTTTGRLPEFGGALLRLARGDSLGAGGGPAPPPPAATGAEPLLLAWAARLFAASGEHRAAHALYDEVAQRYPQSPEAPEAVLAQARSLASRDRSAAMARLEYLILTYPGSALVPVARRELESIRGSVPPA